ncbi:Hsp20/alpha crystallin family protein [Brucepastera parasyntrophica]|uniref:Hsp20/alpha crystallin family protein n=1 Tax=Brucepastera parasyntrophica TaxID=2880008 RepID=UPI0021094107|nr:Hsp20/alpha crystallin family protein [Brucepastera parasyntrophica]ULQ60898.1 Hsp20/alpha crystallin family protein [Brucepastera parasyntrophica]
MNNTLSLFNPVFSSDVFDALDKGMSLFAPVSPNTFTVPRVDVRETENAYILDMDLPGFAEKDIEVHLKDRILTIQSSKNESGEDKKKEDGVEYLVRERHTASFARRFTLPADIDAESVEAKFKNGVLTVNIPRKPETRPRAIEVKAT